MEEVPFEDRHVPKVEIEWNRSIWWWFPLTRAIHPAMRMFSLVFSLLAVLIAQAGVSTGQWLFKPDWPAELLATQDAQPFSWQLVQRLPEVINSLSQMQQFDTRGLACATFILLWLTATLSLFGGVLARRAAVELGQRTVAPWGESLRIVASRFLSYLWAGGMHLVAILAMLAPIAMLGLLGRLGSLGAAVAGVLLLACYPFVFGIGRFAVSAIVCFPLSVCGISLEKKADAFEGFSRSNAYFFQRPVVAALCSALLVVIGAVGEQIVFWSLNSGWWLVSRTYATAGSLDASETNTYLSYGLWLTQALVAAYWFSFFWSASAATYLILRKSVDHTELDEMDSIESPIEQSLPDIPATPPSSSESEIAAGESAEPVDAPESSGQNEQVEGGAS